MSDPLSGPNQAQAMLRRVSPEGRALARREQQRRQKQSLRLIGRWLLVVLAVAVALGAYDLATGYLPGLLVIVAVLVVLVAALAMPVLGRVRHPSPAALERAPLASLPQTTSAWLETQVPALPASAAALADAIVAELGALGPQLARLSGREPAAEAARRLLAVELPALVEHHRSVPPSLRAAAREGGQSADDHLVNGLGIIREEVGRLSEQIARGDVDALAVQDRFLELKYQGEAMSGE